MVSSNSRMWLGATVWDSVTLDGTRNEAQTTSMGRARTSSWGPRMGGGGCGLWLEVPPSPTWAEVRVCVWGHWGVWKHHMSGQTFLPRCGT